MDETQTNQEVDFSDFYEADGGDGGNHPDTPEDPVAGTDSEQENPSEKEDEGNDGDEGTEAPDEQNNDPGGPSKPEPTDGVNTFTIKVNKEERTVNREEVISLAQKGADYDRVKQQLADSRKDADGLREQINKSQGILELLDIVAARTKSTPEDLIEDLYVSLQGATGVSADAAREALRADKLQKKLTQMETQRSRQKAEEDEKTARATREIAEFRKEFPGVELGEELVKKLMPDVQAGVSLTSAYRKMEAAKKDAEIAELQRKLAAAEQNKKNRAASPGSQKDSGGKVKREAIDDFIDAL